MRKRKGEISMETIRLFVEELIIRCGLHGSVVPVVRHILLVIVVVLLAMLSYSVGRRVILLLTKVVARKGMQWNKALLVSVCRIIPAIAGVADTLHGYLYHCDGDAGCHSLA